LPMKGIGNTAELQRSDARMLRSLSVVMAVLVLPLAAQDPVAEAARSAADFVKKSVVEQKRLELAVRETAAAISGDSYDAVRALIAAAEARQRAAGKATAKPVKTKKPKKPAPKAESDLWEMPAAFAYV